MSRLSSDDWLALVENFPPRDFQRRPRSMLPRLSVLPPVALSERRGAFVSLYVRGKLRGCVGQVENPGPLADVVARSAISAALHDSRFPPIAADEIAALKIEISVLSVPERILPEAIVVGTARALDRARVFQRIAAAASRRGTKLVCPAAFWRKPATRQALPRDAWRDPATELFGFTAEVYSEKGRGQFPNRELGSGFLWRGLQPAGFGPCNTKPRS